MTGTLTTRKTSSGHEYYYVRLSYKDPKTGRWKDKIVSTGLPVKNNKKKANSMIQDIIKKYEYLEFSINTVIDPDIKLCEYLDKWLEDTKSSIRQSTFEGYEARVGRIKKYFAGKNPKVKSITPAMMDAFFKYCLKYGKKNQKTGEPEPLSVRSVRSYKSILNSAFTQARIDGLLMINPVSDISVGKKPNNKYQQGYLFLTEDEVTTLMNFLSEEYPKLLPMAFFGTYYGLRRSEILGLKWNAIHEYHPVTDNSSEAEKQSLGYIAIRHTVVRVKSTISDDTVKAVESNRDLDLFPTAIKCLNSIRDQQAADKAFYGKEYQNKDGYVVCWEDCHYYDPNYITREFKKAMTKFGRPEITLHKLRHTCASILIDKGWDVKKIQYWLGHEDIQTTLEIYAHYIKHRDNRAGNDMEQASSLISGLFD